MENTLTNLQDIIEGIKNSETLTKEIIFDSISNLSVNDLETIATNLPIAYSDVTYDQIKDNLVTFFRDFPKFSDFYILNDNETWETFQDNYDNLEKNELIIYFIKNIYYNNVFCKNCIHEPDVNTRETPSENNIELLLREGIIHSDNTVETPLDA